MPRPQANRLSPGARGGRCIVLRSALAREREARQTVGNQVDPQYLDREQRQWQAEQLREEDEQTSAEFVVSEVRPRVDSSRSSRRSIGALRRMDLDQPFLDLPGSILTSVLSRWT